MKKKVVSIIMLSVFVLCVFFGVCFLAQHLDDRAKQLQDDKVLDEIRDNVVDDSSDKHSDDDVQSRYNPSGDSYYKSVNHDMMWWLERRINFGYLKNINSDVKTWITIPNTNIDYYVMQEPKLGETFYLWRDIYKQTSYWGSVLTPKEPDENIDDAHLVLYGHHMIDSSVGFGSLLNTYYSGYSGSSHRNIYLYYPDHSECWRVWTARYGNKNDSIYNMPYELSSRSYEKLIQGLEKNGMFSVGKSVSKNEHMLVLSTCGNGSSDSRFYVVAKPYVRYYYKNKNLMKLK
jgi:SrtB family sortase